MNEISRKNNLAKNLTAMKRAFEIDYDFFPETWILPEEFSQFRQNINNDITFIIKPDAKSQGKGIYLLKNLNDIDNIRDNVAQRYISEPLLVDGLKFDLRIYAVIVGCDPLKVYINKEGLARFATENYQTPNSANMNQKFMHLTNYSVNKSNQKFMQSEGVDDIVSHKRTLSSIFQVAYI